MGLALDVINSYLFISILITAFFAMYSFAKKRSVLHIMFAILCFFIMVYIFGYIMEINVSGLEQKIFWNKVQYIGIPFFPSIWILFTLEYTNNKLKSSNLVKILVFIIPLSTFVIRYTNDYHHLYYKNISLSNFTTFSVLALEKGPWYFIHTIFLAICLILAGIMIIRYSKNIKTIKRASYLLVVFVSFMPFIGVLINLFNLSKTYLDFTAFSVPLITLLLFNIIFSNNSLRFKSYARDKLFENSSNGIMLINSHYEIIDYNKAINAIFPFLTDDYLNRNLEVVFSDRLELVKSIKTKSKYQLNIQINEHSNYYYVTTEDVLSNNGNFEGLSVTFSDITEIVLSSNKLAKLAMEFNEEKNLLKTTLLSVGDGVISTDLDANIVLMNPIAEMLTGWTQTEAFGQSIDSVLNLTNKDGKPHEINPVHNVLELECAYEMDGDTYLISRNGKQLPIEDSAAPIRDDKGIITGVVIVFRDFTEKKKRNEMVQFLSYHDQLTGIYNRRYFEEKMVEFDNEKYLPISLIMLDVNGLKLANDAFGHAIGDELLKLATKVIDSNCRHGDVFSRIGGDEFVILMPNTSGDKVEMIVRKIRTELFEKQIGDLELSISFGWDTKNIKTKSLLDVFKKAEDNMYQHKLNESPLMRERTIHRIIESFHKNIPNEKETSLNVGKLCEKMGLELKLSKEQINLLVTAGMLHDIGKIAIDHNVIDHPQPLSETDWIETKRHAEVGYRILSAVNNLVPVAEIVLAHHENWNGTGYPKGLTGEQIPLQSRIIRLADSFDAMTSDRIYRKSLGRDAAKLELLRNAGICYDPDLVKIFVEKVI